jgi:hypothetical protein
MTTAIAVKERPILFSGEMVRAILAGRKTQTRRVMKPQPVGVFRDKTATLGCVFDWPDKKDPRRTDSPYGQSGDHLWVRETLHRGEDGIWHYSADCSQVLVDPKHETEMRVWAHHKEQPTCVSIHMPRWASRLTLEVTKVRVERLQDVSMADAQAEGLQCIAHLHSTWTKIHGEGSWEKNPWVWAIEFAVLVP